YDRVILHPPSSRLVPLSPSLCHSFHSLFFFFSLLLPPPRSTLFPYTTLFRSHWNDITIGHKHLGPKAIVSSFSIWSVNLESESKDRKSTRLNSSHVSISYAVFCLKKKKKKQESHQEENVKIRQRALLNESVVM